MVSGDSLKIHTGKLGSGVYRVYLGITDSKGSVFTQNAIISIAHDPITLEQETRIVQGVTFNMRYVPSGAFMVPDPMYEIGERDTKVDIFTGFWIGETEVTQELYQLIMGENPSYFKDNPAPGEIQNRRPVESVIFYEAILFCNRLSIATGREPVYNVWGVSDWETYLKWAISSKSNTAVFNIFADDKANGYRLPTYEEWAWAAIGADIQNPGQINTTGANKHYSGGPVGSAIGLEEFVWVHHYPDVTITHEVGKKRSNELGLYDMSGNAYEWVWGYYFTSVSGFYRIYSINAVGSSANPHERVIFRGFRIVSNQ
jgi:formylglycine-generating enzyme required for sulfatase activity